MKTRTAIMAKRVGKPKIKNTVKKRKLGQTQLGDSMSETISFVIKGKLTPIKPLVKNTKFKRQKRKVRIVQLQEELPKLRSTKSTPKLENDKKADCGTKHTKKDVRKAKTSEKKVIYREIKAQASKTKKQSNVKLSVNKGKMSELKKNYYVKSPTSKQEQVKKIETNSQKKQKATTKQEKTKKKYIKSPMVTRVADVDVTRESASKSKVIKKNAKLITKQKLTKIKSEDTNLSDDVSTTSDEITLDLLRQQSIGKHQTDDIKKEPEVSEKTKSIKVTNTNEHHSTTLENKKCATSSDKVKAKPDQKRKLKLFALWNGPKRHRVASLNALAKVHCLYENEGRCNIIDNVPPIRKDTTEKKDKIATKKEKTDKAEKVENVEKPEKEIKEESPPVRNLRTAPGLRGVGKHWDMHDTMSSSSEDTGGESSTEVQEEKPKKEPPKKSEEKKPPVKRRKRTEIIMDLKDMVVRKRMASLNASAILAASYSLEKNASRSPKSSSDSDSESDVYSDESEKKKYDDDDDDNDDDDAKKEDKVIEVRTTPNKKVAVIVNQDTDVTITGVYVNSTTRSTHHEGYCSIAGMQYRISATSHTQTAATAVATETLLQSASSSSQENSNGESTPGKSYTPLDALSNMQPPSTSGSQHGVQLPHHHLGPPHISPQLSPLPRRHGCSSAFSAPPGHYPSAHHHPPAHPPTVHSDQGYIHGYYQPAGPLINVPHGHTQPPTLGKSAPLSETSSVSPPPTQPPPAPSSGGDSSDNDVIITSVTNPKDASPPQQPYRLGQYPASGHSTYPYGYPTHYYHAPHPAPSYPHHDLCYSPNSYLHKSYPPYRRYLVGPPPSTQYFQTSPPDLYNPQPSAPPPTATQQNQQVVTATPSAAGSASSYQTPPNGPPPGPPTILESYPSQPPPTLVESYPPPYYAGYGPPPPPPCYSHSPTRSSLPYINATYQNCPCPIQSCPKNVHTGPLIGNNKRSNISSITKDSILLQPVALALPMEPASATGPPSPARGSAGMPPPPSPAGATYQAPPTPKRETPEPVDIKTMEKRRKPARVGKSAVRETLHQNTMLLMCREQEPPSSYLNGVKREVESPKEELKKEIVHQEVVVSKVEAPHLEEKVENITPAVQETKTEMITEPIKQMPCLKQEETDSANTVKEVASLQVPPLPEQLEPCVKTVAENVKVKNMKRKPSITNTAIKEEPAPKKIKLEKPSGSYKDLIKKSYTAIHITNGKRKLLSRNLVQKLPKIRMKKPQTKRKHSPTKEMEAKKLKLSKPLTACNHNSKVTVKEKEKTYIEADLIENKEPIKKGKKCNSTATKCKKIAPVVLDNLLSKNSVDRTIESVISENNNTRTLKNGANGATLRTFAEKCNAKVKAAEVKKEQPKEIVKKNGNACGKSVAIKNKVIECKKSGAAKRKLKCGSADPVPQVISRVPRRSLPLPRWSNGWEWKGEPFDGKVFLNSDEAIVIRRCYPAMVHSEGDIIEPKDCVLLKAGPRKNDLPFVAKIAALWENPEDGEMMMSLLWYYRPEHTEQGRLPSDQPDEVFASRHKDSNSVACIEDKCYVLTFNEYCRYRKNLRRLEEGVEEIPQCIPSLEIYPRSCRQPPASVVTPPEMIFFCRRVYDFRQKRIVKNPS